MNRSPSIETLIFCHRARTAIRALMDAQGFIELETPYLLTANTPDPFIDPIFANAHGLGLRTLQLHTSPEIWLKKSLALGFDKIYEMARVFRDDPLGRSHNREFTMLEWYRTNSDLDALVVDAEEIFKETASVAKDLRLIEDNPDHHFLRTDLQSLFLELAAIDLESILHKIAQGHHNELQLVLTRKGDHLPSNASFEDAFFHVMLKYIEPDLPPETPVVISRWPFQLAALARPCLDNSNFCDRFEIYYQGLEIANAYQECADGEVLRTRFVADNAVRKRLGKPLFSIDETFLACMDGLPPTAGIALGIDRLFLAVLRKEDIAELIFGFGDR